MSRRRLYYLALFLGFAGQLWITYSYFRLERQEEAFNTCIFRRISGLPCPSCGTVHSIVSILHCRFEEAVHENPLGFAGLLLVSVVPFWILADLFSGRESFYRFYGTIDRLLKRKSVFIPLILLILALWIVKLLFLYF